jgi:hypothetical protein
MLVQNMRSVLRRAIVLLAMIASVSSANATMPSASADAGPSAFPSVRDFQSVRITLKRSLCFGTCPFYSIEIRGTGNVLYRGSDCVALRGEKADTIPVKRVRKLVAAFERAEFFALRDSYRSRVTDIPTFTLSLSLDGKQKSVEDYGGTMVGMPDTVRALEDAVDRAASTERWVYEGGRSCHGQAVNDDWRKSR